MRFSSAQPPYDRTRTVAGRDAESNEMLDLLLRNIAASLKTSMDPMTLPDVDEKFSKGPCPFCTKGYAKVTLLQILRLEIRFIYMTMCIYIFIFTFLFVHS